ncbi:hypothetical protein Patl1_07526 [Pistacia atlantica]|uniref:Uncharacterized protein n=1 Tax=Pistacia atlantica TaxID=434234 RepID=A0ACC1AI93_9ROSI|nr:hypothetical protein Patl1_07526 [Pistacia atlantica]
MDCRPNSMICFGQSILVDQQF